MLTIGAFILLLGSVFGSYVVSGGSFDVLVEALPFELWTIGGAAIDVWWQYPNAAEPERRPSRHPFHQLPNAIMTPHCSGWTAGMVRRRWDEVADNINRFVRGDPLINVVTTT